MVHIDERLASVGRFLGAYTKAVTHGHLICAADLPVTYVEQSVDLREYITISFFTA